ncbi:MAG: L,D-transpeptidase family protein [Acidobacteria bacterium]|jgi:murein L,D-transpeptidase YcbB/YkuD|nr:L,D-transpeptidase family protein [Acidobacteriota bacterium]
MVVIKRVPSRPLWAALLAAAALAAPAARAAEPAQAALPPAASAAIDAGRLAALRWPDFSDYTKWVAGFYDARGGALAWTAAGRPTPQARAVIAQLEAADAKGVHAEDYDGGRWAARLAALERGTASPQQLADFDLALTVSAMRFVSDLHIGRVNPERLGFHLDVEHKKYDLSALLEELVAADDVAARLDAVEPQYEYYRALQAALARTRELAPRIAALQPLPVPAKPLEAGGSYDAMPKLAELLVLLGDLPAGEQAAASAASCGAPMVAAVKRFQERHGLAPDGVAGPATFRELNTPPAARLRQIELTLERWRWLAHEFGEPPIVVNIPSFQLRAFEREGDAVRPALTMNVVVGKEYQGAQTPIFARQMKYLVFSPYWEVPPSIARAEILPKMSRDPGYAERNHYVIEGAGGRLPVDASSIAAVRAGQARVRQTPGRHNALGLVKFMFPNEFNVYLHSTPSQAAFSREERALSHGCVRVEQPVELAEFVLKDDPAWNRAAIEAAMNAGEPRTVNLKRPIWVFILYGTAFVDEQGTVHFYRDVYGHDAKLDAALKRGYPYPG